jgi:hypothetical protein
MRLVCARNIIVLALSAAWNLARALDLFSISVDAIRQNAKDVLRLRQLTHALPTRCISGFGFGGGTGRLSRGITIFGGPWLASGMEPSFSMGWYVAVDMHCLVV